MCKASLIFQSNIELALSVILKERKLYDSKTCCGGAEMFKIWDFVVHFDMFFNPSFKMTRSFANVPRTAASTSKFIC